ncbi:MAG TPA: peptidylprolyl isomerase, partial [candidate division Zixibacteria bacterium]|nr:peptidylprolyl isomerase [candidate division Zixibacteria bacterium]
TFAEWARSYSEDGTAADGGELGFYAIQDLDSFYVNGALSVGIGAVSGPVRSTFGWHIIKLNGIRDSSGAETTNPAKAAEINTAHILLRVQASDETVANAERRARTFYHKVKEVGFEAAATELGVELNTPAPFQKGGSIQFLGSDYFAGEWAFNSEIGDISGIYDNASNYFVMELTGKISGGTIPLEDIRASLENLVRNEKLKQMSLDTMQAVYSEVQAGAEMEAAATKHGATYVKTTAMLTRNNPLPPPIGRDPIAVGLAFSLREPGELSEPTIADRGAVIIRLLEKETPGLDEFNQARDSVAANLLNMKQNALWQNWYSDIVKNAVSENYLERQIAESRAQADTGAIF